MRSKNKINSNFGSTMARGARVRRLHEALVRNAGARLFHKTRKRCPCAKRGREALTRNASARRLRETRGDVLAQATDVHARVALARGRNAGRRR